MKFALLGFFVSLSFVFLHGQSLTGFEEGSGQDSSETTTTTATVADSTVHIGPFVVVDEPGVRRLCTCAEVQKCSFVHESEITKNECATQCSHHLVPIDNDTFSLTECFKDDFLSELQASDTCIRANIQDLCSNSITAKKIPYSNLGLLQFDYPPITNPLYRSNVFMVKAEVVYTAIRYHQNSTYLLDWLRTYQHCFSNCYRQKEAECRQHLK